MTSSLSSPEGVAPPPPPSSTENAKTTNDNNNNRKSISYQRQASLTECEAAFLHAFLIDPPASDPNGTAGDENNVNNGASARTLDDTMLFSLPFEKDKVQENSNDKPLKRPTLVKPPKTYRTLVGLWQAFEDGVTPKQLLGATPKQRNNTRKHFDYSGPETQKLLAKPEQEEEQEDDDDDDEESARSDVEVRRQRDGNTTIDTLSDGDDNASDGSSWAEEEGGFEHFDAWQVLKDEYANDFGFDYSEDGQFPDMDDSQLEQHKFRILGTSADDVSAHPHVLSPPLMDALLNFVPDHLVGENFWLKYSLIRDGASLDTFKRYVRASKYTILAIETTKGDVFGSFTSSAWRTNPGFYGGDPAFLWRMRYNRNSRCHSLFEQAKLEGEIDVHFLIGAGQRVQLSTHDRIGIGEGTLQNINDDDEYISTASATTADGESAEEPKPSPMEGRNYGFGIALEDDLLTGTTSQCGSFCNPCLVNLSSKGEAFEVVNVEVWTFTPCFDVDGAEKLEMSQYFISESIRNQSMRSTTSTNSSGRFSSCDLSQEDFYRRVGQEEENESMRERWQYRNMMDGTIGPKTFNALS